MRRKRRRKRSSASSPRPERGGNRITAQPHEDSPFYLALTEDDPEELYENAPCAYLSALPDGTVIKANETFVTWTGLTKESVVGRRRFQDLLSPGDRIFYETHFGPALRMQGRVREIAVELMTADGGRLPALVNAVLVTEADGAPRVVRIAIFDARERRAYERELVAARRRAEESEAKARSLAQVLQSTFLPPEILDVPGLDIAGRYRPAGDGSEVGGDFYDVFETGRGSWGIVLGDVSGKGAAAATVTAVARYTVRAEAARTSSPAEVLTGVHRALLNHDPERFCTAVFLVVDGLDRGHRLTIASGGHELPLRVGADGSIERIGAMGAILGMLDQVDVREVVVELLPGDTLVLYTDGVVEARREGRFFGEEGLLEVLGSVEGKDATSVADAIVNATLDFQHGDARDDIAVVVLKG